MVTSLMHEQEAVHPRESAHLGGGDGRSLGMGQLEGLDCATQLQPAPDERRDFYHRAVPVNPTGFHTCELLGICFWPQAPTDLQGGVVEPAGNKAALLIQRVAKARVAPPTCAGLPPSRGRYGGTSHCVQSKPMGRKKVE
jgi:hypothetical protein